MSATCEVYVDRPKLRDPRPDWHRYIWLIIAGIVLAIVGWIGIGMAWGVLDEYRLGQRQLAAAERRVALLEQEIRRRDTGECGIALTSLQLADYGSVSLRIVPQGRTR